MSAPTIAADAVSITDGTGKVGAVVDQLVDTPAVDQQVLQLPVDRVLEHPRNPKGRCDDVADLLAGVKAVGITHPLIVASGKAYNAGRLENDREVDERSYVIVGGGHRRREAAIQAGLTTVPCIVRDDLADAKGRRAALFENLHRRQLDPFEEAEAFLELRESYGVSQRDLAGDVGCNQSHISKRLKLLKLPTTVRSAVGISCTIQDAIEFARVADQGPIFGEAWALFSNSRWRAKEAIDRAIRYHEQRVKTEKAKVELAETGVKVLDRSPAWYLHSKKEPTRLDATSLNADKHATEPCHAATIDTDGDIVYACADPSRHLPEGSSKLKLSKSKRDSLASYSRGSSDADKAKRRLMKQLREVRPDRRAFARSLLSGDLHTKMLDGDFEDFDQLALRTFIHGYRPHHDIAMYLLAKAETDQAHQHWADHLDEAIRDTDPVDVRIACAIDAIEMRMVESWVSWGSIERTYLMLLERMGRPMTAPEHERLGDKLQKNGSWKLAEQPVGLDNDVVRCRICGCSDARACDDGCHWVEPDLCSACSDAAGAGLIAAEQPLGEAVTA